MKHSKKRGEGRENKPRRYKGSGFPLSRVLKCTFGFATALVVFVTAYAMVLPALTVSVPRCGIDEHTHTEECYREEKKLICDNTDGVLSHHGDNNTLLIHLFLTPGGNNLDLL